jgi:hypothetical protein
MQSDPLGYIFLPIGKCDLSDLHLLHTFGLPEHKSQQTTSGYLASMLSSALAGARSWVIPASTQDLSSAFGPEAAARDVTQSSSPSSSTVSLPIVSAPADERLFPEPWSEGSRRRNTRTKTKYLLAHPPPITRSKRRLSARPRMILQLQRVSTSARPMPAFDIVSSTAFASRVTRRVPEIMKGEKRLSTDDLVLMRSEMYDQDSMVDGNATDESGDESMHHRDVLGTIAHAKYARDGSINRDEISLQNGLKWEANCLKVGVYEFSGKNHNGLKLRWVSRRPAETDIGQHSLPTPPPKRSSSRFTFSILNPDTRRHPVIATLTRDNKLDILDRFPTNVSSAKVSSPSSTPQSPPPSDFSSDTSYFDRPISGVSSCIETDENLRMLIILTGIWVTFKEGWSEVPSKAGGMTKKAREDHTSRSLSNRDSSTESIPKGSSQERWKPCRMQRASTAPSAQRSGGKSSALSGGANTVRPLGTRRETANVPPSLQRNPRMILHTSSGDKEEAGLSNLMTNSNFNARTDGLASEFFSDATKPQETRSGGDEGAVQMSVQTSASTMNKSLLRQVPVILEGKKVSSEVDKGNRHLRRWGKFRAACKSLAGPCMRSDDLPDRPH